MTVNDRYQPLFGPKPCRKCGHTHYAGDCPTPPPFRMPRIVTPYRHHNRHPWAQSGDQPNRVWMLLFADPDRRNMVWDGPEAEHDAKEAYRQFAPSWSCTLMATVAAGEI